MKDKYIKRVGKNLRFSGSKKREILRDLKEIFASALEHGETEEQVIQRLGAPETFAASVNREQNAERTGLLKRKGMLSSIIALSIAVAAFAVYGVMQFRSMPSGGIGQAQATTNIQIESMLHVNILHVILAVGFCAVLFAAIQIGISVCRNRRRQ